MQELFCLDGWVEGQFVLLMFCFFFKEKENNFQKNENIVLLYLELGEREK